jgi:hypothetical protein
VVFAVAACADDASEDSFKDPDASGGSTADGGAHSEDDPQASIDGAIDDLKETVVGCNLLTEGDWIQAGTHPYPACVLACLQTADCDQWKALICDEEPGSLEACVTECDEAEFTCDDGTTLPLDYECDAEVDCEDGSDEHDGCSYFECGDGTMIDRLYVCDEEEDCEGGADEADCAQSICN